MSGKTLFVIVFAITLSLLVGTVSARSDSERTPMEASLNLAPAADRLSPEIQISTPSTPTDYDRFKPAVAYNSKHNEYLVVWHNKWPGNRDIYAQRVSASGSRLGSWFAIASGTFDRFQPAIAYNPTNDEYLIVWMYDVHGNSTAYEIWGKVIPWNGPGSMAERVIFAWPNRQFWTPRVVWNSYRNEYFVLWNALDATTLQATDVAGVHVAASTGIPDPAAHIVTTANNPHQADFVYNLAADGYLVVWRYMYSTSDGDIYGRFLNRDGSPKGGEFPINVQNVDQQNPAVTTNSQDRYLVVWQHHTTPSNWDIAGQYLDNLGAGLVGPFPIAASTYDAKTPDVVVAGNGSNEYMTIWEQTTPTGTAIRARRDRLSGSTTTPVDQFEVAPGGFWENKSPAVAADLAGYLMVYEGDSTSDPTVTRHIYGRMWWSQASYLPLILR